MYPSTRGLNERDATFIDIKISEIVYEKFFASNEWKKPLNFLYKSQQYGSYLYFRGLEKLMKLQMK